ncbi:arginine N-succinyltransferase [Pseudoduganella namucuonensis]|uniref:Arginine succinyltransferase n=1 Tax=Pseudoduganella namucuonensis TaxID=1035707 RepID=A0A1I7KSK0_9BURK|nr:arginine N-succinyltransferase [Pseudoduganella namucuonensis]SFV00421.1 arginine succinyltransferase [Pseudoduganella namucuonensis]
MLIVRPAAPTDLDAVLELARQIGPGMTTLKADRGALERRLEIASASFAGTAAPIECDYLFVMEDCATGRVGGVCAIKRSVGLDEPFYSYRLGTMIHSSAEANVFAQMQALYLSYDMTGCAELCSLYLHPDYRQGLNGKLLSKSRFLFIAQFPELFSERIFAEMRGYQDIDGSSPFWESLGRHFFKMDFQAADDMCGRDKAFISQLMPRHPLYTALLSEEARAAIGKTHVDTVPARRLLEQEGLRYEGYLDIFDGGPVLQAKVGDLRASRESMRVVAEAGTALAGVDALVSTTSMRDFRVIAARAAPEGGRLVLPPEQLDALRCAPGEEVVTMPVQPARAAGIRKQENSATFS